MAPWPARGVIEGDDPGGQPCEPNRVAAAPSGLKVLGFVNASTLCAIIAKSTGEQ